MALHFIIYLVCFALVFTYNVLDDSYVPFIVDIVFLALTVVGLVVITVLYRKVKVGFGNKTVTVERGEKISIPVFVKNESRIPIAPCKIKVVLRHTDKRGKKKKSLHVLGIARNSENVFFEYGCENCELVRMNIPYIHIYDFMHLFCIRKKICDEADLIVMPHVPRMDVVSKFMASVSGDSDDLFSPNKPGDDPTEIFGIREYAGGDKIRNIHWKLSAKIGELMVKDYSLPLHVNDTIIFETLPVNDKKRIIRNEMYEGLYGLLYAMTSRGYGITVCYVNDSFVNKRIETQNDIYTLFADLYLAKWNTESTAAELYYASHENARNRIFYVCATYDSDMVNRMRLLNEIGPVYYLVPEITGGAGVPIKYV